MVNSFAQFDDAPAASKENSFAKFDKVDTKEAAPESKEDDMSYGAGTGYTRGGLPFKSTQEPLSPQHFLDATMAIPSIGAEAGVLKGATALENIATRASPKVAQTMAEGKVIPKIATVGKAATAGGVGGGVYGAGTGRDIEGSAAIGAGGALAGEGAGYVFSKGYSAAKNYLNRNLPEHANNEAVSKILDRFDKDVKGGGVSAEQALKLIDEARKTGKQLILPDVAGANVKGIAGSVARVPGPGKEMAQGFLNKRDALASKRMLDDTNKYLSTESGKKTTQALAEIRSAEGKPLFEEAYAGGSMAPLETQFEKEFQEVASKTSDVEKEISKVSPRVTTATAKLSQAKDIYQQQAAKKELETVQKELSDKRAQLAQAKMAEAKSHEMLQRAQADRTASAPGAIWNPRIQRLLELPIVRKGINQGIKLEKQNAAAEGRAFNASEYAIIGEDKAGDPIVGTVPNMRLLASAKEGLDGLLEGKEMRDELTGRLTKEGVSVDKVRRALLEQLKTENPAYAKALESWAGHSQSMQAVRYGRKAFSYAPEDIAEEVANMTPAEREFAKIGIADTIREKIMRTGIAGDEAKAVINNEWTKSQLRPFFNSDAEFNSYIKSVTDERQMFNTKAKLVGNSATAERVAEDSENRVPEMLGIGANVVRGNFGTALKGVIKAAQDAKWKNERLNEAAARILFDPNITLDALKQPLGKEPVKGALRKSAPLIGTGASENMINSDQ